MTKRADLNELANRCSATKKILNFFFIVFLFHLLLIYFVFVVQAELQLHFHNLHFEQFFKDGRGGGGGTVLRAEAFNMGDCQHFWTVSFFGFLVKAFGNGNGIDGTEMELLTAPRISSAFSLSLSLCLPVAVSLSVRQSMAGKSAAKAI